MPYFNGTKVVTIIIIIIIIIITTIFMDLNCD
jgi:hypothetical protein